MGVVTTNVQIPVVGVYRQVSGCGDDKCTNPCGGCVQAKSVGVVTTNAQIPVVGVYRQVSGCGDDRPSDTRLARRLLRPQP